MKRKSQKRLIKIYGAKEKWLRINHPKLMDLIVQYKKATGSTGCELIDYATLYENIRRFKWKNIYEAGTGVSTLAIAYALYMNHKEYGIEGKVTSMEEFPEYHEMSCNLMPDFLKPYVENICSDIVGDYYSVFRGHRYKDVPDEQYDFCWIDGPRYAVSEERGTFSFDFDLFYIVARSKIPVYAMIDGRYTTVYVAKQIFGKKVQAQKKKKAYLGIVNGATKGDMVKLECGDFFRPIYNIPLRGDWGKTRIKKEDTVPTIF